MSNQLTLINTIVDELKHAMKPNEVEYSGDVYEGFTPEKLMVSSLLRFYSMNDNGNNNSKVFAILAKNANDVINKHKVALVKLGIKYHIAQSEKGWLPIDFTWVQ